MKWMYVGVIVGLSAIVAALVVKNNDLRTRLNNVDTSRKLMATDKAYPEARPASYAERMLFVSACKEVMSSCKDGDCFGIRKYRDFLAENAPSVSVENAEAIGDAMCGIIQQSFIFSQGLEEFKTVEQFRRFASVNFDFAMYFGEVDVRRGKFEMSTAKEICAYNKFSEYKKHFCSIGRSDLEGVATEFLHRLADHIESPSGYVRQCIRHVVWLNSKYAEIMCPGKELSKAGSDRLARAYAKGLINVGYTPKWLKEYEDSNVDQASE